MGVVGAQRPGGHAAHQASSSTRSWGCTCVKQMTRSETGAVGAMPGCGTGMPGCVGRIMPEEGVCVVGAQRLKSVAHQARAAGVCLSATQKRARMGGKSLRHGQQQHAQQG